MWESKTCYLQLAINNVEAVHFPDKFEYKWAVWSGSLNHLLIAGESRQMLSNYIEQVVSEDGGRKYKCVLCTQIFHKKEHIENHVENIHFPGTFQYNCKYCGQSFDRRNMLYKHHMSCEYKEK